MNKAFEWSSVNVSLVGHRPVVLIVDDQSTNLHLLTELILGIAPDAQISTFNRPYDALNFAAENHLDLVLTDYRMPEMNGIGVIKRLRAYPHLIELPIIMVTAVEDMAIRYEALDVGANDFLTRPINLRECGARCRNLINMRGYQLQTRQHAQFLEGRVAEVLASEREQKMAMLQHLARVGEMRDSDTGEHLARMAKYSVLLARRIGLNDATVHLISMAAPLHDLGKVAIPDSILLAPRRLTPEELVIMRTHSMRGYEMLSGSRADSMQMSADIARHHHERYDGKGYPDGLAGEEIPLSARIVAIADVFDALISNRPYKAAWRFAEVQDWMRSESGKHFDPLLVEVFLSDLPALEDIWGGKSSSD
ncbi:MAG TPA: HD domain-containing phosphohydrolase [Rhodocyclaceae bacterium]|nr:HD domain-containing phosphohydrolase [Rhodocyclaceae bacterium]